MAPLKVGDVVRIREDATPEELIARGHGEEVLLHVRGQEGEIVGGGLGDVPGTRKWVLEICDPHARRIIGYSRWVVYETALEGYNEAPKPQAPKCECPLSRGCSCGAMQAEMQAKGMVKDRWSGLWVKVEA